MSAGLGLKEQIGYGVGDFAINLYFQSALLFLLYFYTDIVGIAAGTAAAIFLVARFVDAVTDPLMGMIADRTRTRWGKFRPWLVAGALPLAAIAVLTFSAPALSPGVKVAYAYATYIAFGIAYTVVSIPYSSLTAAMTADPHERTTLSSYRMAFAMLGGVTVAAATLPLVEAFGGGSEGFSATMGLYGILACVLFATTFALTKERVEPVDARPPTLKETAAVLSGNRPLWIILIAFWMGMMAFTIRSAAVVFYFKYNLGREDLVPFFMGAIAVVTLAGIVLTPLVSRRIGKKATYIAGAVAGSAGAVGLFLAPYDAIGLIFVTGLSASFFFAAPTVMGWAMLPDTVEFAEWKTGVRAEGAIYATASFFQKLAMAVGGALSGLLLAAVGYVPNLPQEDAALTGIVFMVALAPVMAMAVGVLAIAFYPLTEERHAALAAELAARRPV